MIAKLEKTTIDQQWILSWQLCRRKSNRDPVGLGFQIAGNLFSDKEAQSIRRDVLLLPEVRQGFRESGNGKASGVGSDLVERNLLHLVTLIIDEMSRIKLQG